VREFGPNTLRIQETAERLKEAYTELRRFYHSQPHYRPNKKWDTHFEKAAELVLELGAPVREYVKAQFETLKYAPMVMPNHLCGSKARHRYEKLYSPEMQYEEAMHRFKHQFETLVSRRDCGFDIEKVLLDEHSETFDSLFRCLMGKVMGFENVFQQYEEEAKEIVLEYPMTKRVYREAIPENRREGVSWL